MVIPAAVVLLGLQCLAPPVPEDGLIVEHANMDNVMLLQRQAHVFGFKDSGVVQGGRQANASDIFDSGAGLLDLTCNDNKGALHLFQKKRMVLEGMANSRTCSWWTYLTPMLVTIAVLVPVLIAHGTRAKSVSCSHGMCDCLMLITVMGTVARMINVPDSDALSISLARGPEWSGLFLGVNRWGEIAGEIILGPLLLWPPIWRDTCRRAVIWSLLAMCIGSFLYLLSSWNVPEKPEDVSDSFKNRLSVLLLASRAIMGFGYGTVILIITAVLPKITPLGELPGVFQRRLFNVIVGEGLGPLAASNAYLLDFCPRSAAPRFELVGGVQLMVSLFALIAAIQFLPSINSETNKTATVQKLPSMIVLITGFTLGFVRCFIGASVEVSTTLLLEQNYGWSIASAGTIIGIAFLIGVPIWLGYLGIKPHVSNVNFIRLLVGISAFGAALMFRAPSKLLPKGLMLILGDLMIFPPLYIVSGLTQGMMMQHVPSEEFSRFLNTTTVTVAYSMLLSLSFGYAMVQSRWIIEAGGDVGQDIYAAIQVFCCIGFIALFEVGMNPNRADNLAASKPTYGATSPPAEAHL